MNQYSMFIAALLTPSAVFLNVYSLIVERLNVWLILTISLATLVYWVLCIRNKTLSNKKEKLQIEVLERQLKEKV